MKAKKRDYTVLISLLLVQLLIMTACKKETLTELPDDLLGSWTQTTSCTEKYTFQAKSYTWYKKCGIQPAENSAGDVVEILAKEKMFRDNNSVYIAWHIDGSKLYIYKTRPDAKKPILTKNWYVDANYFTKD